jgi:UDP-N-acetylglucosamine:LPS N-acetylglucosamine transferase
MNARYLEREGYGICAEEADADAVASFLDRLDDFEAALAAYRQDGNTVTLRTIEDRAVAAAAAAPRELRRDRRMARRAQ